MQRKNRKVHQIRRVINKRDKIKLTFKWWLVILILFVISLIISFSFHIYKNYLYMKIIKEFAYAIQTKNYKKATQFILNAEQQLGLTPEVMGKAFKLLNLPSIRFLGIEDKTVIYPMMLVKTKWQIIDNNKKNNKFTIYIEMTKERNQWRINFFLTFRRFCFFKLRLEKESKALEDKIKAFEKSRLLAKYILKTLGVQGYVTEFGTIKTFEGETKGIIN